MIAVSEFTADRIRDLAGVEPIVIRAGAAVLGALCLARKGIVAVREKYALPSRFVLQVGTVEPRKRPDVVAAAARRGPDLPACSPARTPIPRRHPPGRSRLGYVDRADLPALYGAATVVAYASEYEGFGAAAAGGDGVRCGRRRLGRGCTARRGR